MTRSPEIFEHLRNVSLSFGKRDDDQTILLVRKPLLLLIAYHDWIVRVDKSPSHQQSGCE
jgi:hypothetical protein